MTAEGGAPARRWPTAAPDGLLAAVLLAFLATAGFFYVNIMAALVAGLVDGLGFSEGDAGRVGSLNIYGAALGALVAVAIVARVRWRPFAACALVALMAIDAASIFVTEPAPLMAMRFLHGTVGGMLVGVALRRVRAHAHAGSRLRHAARRAVRTRRARHHGACRGWCRSTGTACCSAR
jgi:predicted MFS family arabinose efflux permease